MRVWDVSTGQCDAVLAKHEGAVDALAVLHDGRALAALPDGSLLSGSSDRTLKVWGEAALGVGVGAASDACAATLRAHTDQVLALAALPDGRVASCALDGLVCVWAARG